jgi:hypothetical protein
MRVHYLPFLALGCTRQREPAPSDDEIIQVREFSWQEWRSMLLDVDTSIDAKTIAITLLALPRLTSFSL